MADAVIVDVVRTPGGKRNGSLSGWHPADLAGEVLATLVERNDLDPARVDDVICGCVHQVGAQAYNLGRNSVLAAGWPEAVLAAALFSFVTYQDPADRAPLEASESESRRKKDKGSGAPPDSG